MDALPPYLENGVAKGAIKRLKPRHHEIIRLTFQGVAPDIIASTIGVSPFTVRVILKSPLAQAELARLTAKAEEKLTDIPMKARMLSEINGYGIDSLRLARRVVNDTNIDIRTRSRLAMHGMDRAIFDKMGEDERPTSIRDVLRRLDEVADTIRNSTLIPIQGAEVVEGESV